MKEKFLKIWKDPVGSKIISALIIGLGLIIFNSIYALTSELDFKTAFNTFFDIQVKLWIVILVFLLYLISTGIFTLYKKNKFKPYKYDDKSLELDTALFNKIRNEIIVNDSIRWVRTNNFAGFSFREDYLQPFDNIEYESQAADFEFLNPNLENLKIELVESILDFNSFLLPNIFNGGNNRLTVPPEWETEQYDRFVKAVDGIHQRTQILAKKYDQFIKEGRRTLKV
jgi:hypothetical protein